MDGFKSSATIYRCELGRNRKWSCFQWLKQKQGTDLKSKPVGREKRVFFSDMFSLFSIYYLQPVNKNGSQMTTSCKTTAFCFFILLFEFYLSLIFIWLYCVPLWCLINLESAWYNGFLYIRWASFKSSKLWFFPLYNFLQVRWLLSSDFIFSYHYKK